ncbi:alpha/beta fold hydrolase [Flindersiella endophytica]
MSGTTALPALDGVEHHDIELPGLRMHVVEAGPEVSTAGSTVEPVLLLHGFPQHWWEWRAVIPGLAEHHRVICPDLRGAGWTDAPAGGYNREQLLADVIGLLDARGLDRVHVLAHDWGAILGFLLCLRHPERVGRYISCAIPHPYLRFDHRMLPAMWRMWFQFAIVTPGLGPRLLGSGRQPLARHLLGERAAGRPTCSEADLEIFLARMREPARTRAAAALYRGFIQPEGRRIIGGAYRDTRLTTPTRLLIGAEDPVVRAEFMGGYEPYADDLRVETIAGAAHFLVDQQPEAVLERALEFFG